MSKYYFFWKKGTLPLELQVITLHDTMSSMCDPVNIMGRSDDHGPEMNGLAGALFVCITIHMNSSLNELCQKIIKDVRYK